MIPVRPIHAQCREGTATAPFGELFPAVSDMGPKPGFQRARTGRFGPMGGRQLWPR